MLEKQLKENKKVIENFGLKQADENEVEIRNLNRIKSARDGDRVRLLSTDDFALSGFTTDGCTNETITVDYTNLDDALANQLQPYDILIAETRNSFSNIAIIGELEDSLIADDAILIRFLGDNVENKAIALYVFLKSPLGATLISSWTLDHPFRRLSRSRARTVELPVFNDEFIAKAKSIFDNSQQLSNHISKLQSELTSLYNSVG